MMKGVRVELSEVEVEVDRRTWWMTSVPSVGSCQLLQLLTTDCTFLRARFVSLTSINYVEFCTYDAF